MAFRPVSGRAWLGLMIGGAAAAGTGAIAPRFSTSAVTALPPIPPVAPATSKAAMTPLIAPRRAVVARLAAGGGARSTLAAPAGGAWPGPGALAGPDHRGPVAPVAAVVPAIPDA